jgi:hypothetical protein
MRIPSKEMGTELRKNPRAMHFRRELISSVLIDDPKQRLPSEVTAQVFAE